MDDVPEQAMSVLPPLYVSPREAARLLSIGRSRVYELLATGELRARKDGRRTLVEVDSIRAYGESLPEWEPQ